MPTVVGGSPPVVEGKAREAREKRVLGPRQSLFVALAGCMLLASVLAFSGLGTRPLISPAEARYALIAREMLESGDWIQPHFNHVRYDEKPPLTYWCVAISYRFFGFTEFASRLPSALAYVGTVLATFLLALELVGSGTAGNPHESRKNAGWTRARCEPATTPSCPERSSAPVTEIPTVKLQQREECRPRLQSLCHGRSEMPFTTPIGFTSASILLPPCSRGT